MLDSFEMTFKEFKCRLIARDQAEMEGKECQDQNVDEQDAKCE